MRMRSPWILHFDTGSCNGCDLEVWALLTPKYDVERFGMVNKANPKHADILLLTGPVTKKTEDRLMTLYNQTPGPKVVGGLRGLRLQRSAVLRLLQRGRRHRSGDPGRRIRARLRLPSRSDH